MYSTLKSNELLKYQLSFIWFCILVTGSGIQFLVNKSQGYFQRTSGIATEETITISTSEESPSTRYGSCENGIDDNQEWWDCWPYW